MKKILSVLLMLVVLGGSIVGCGGSGKGPGDVTMLYIDAFVRGDADGIISYNSAIEGLINEASGGSGSLFESSLLEGLEQSGTFLDEEQKKGLIEGYKKTAAIVEVSVVDEKIDGDSAVVTLDVKGVDVGAAIEAKLATWMDDVFAGAISADTTPEEIEKMSFDMVIEVLNNPVLKPESQKITINLTKEKGKWVVPESEFDVLFSSMFGE